MSQFVYFARCEGMDGPIKIGCSERPHQRIKALSTWAPYPVEIIFAIPGTYQTESRVHAYFSDLHSHCEWFRAAPVLLEAIERLKAGEPLESVIDMNARGSIRGRRRTEEERRRASEAMKATWARKRARGEPWSFAGRKRHAAAPPADESRRAA